ncbi:MAG TPA: gliding motility-associated C-terminal domain-containing protein [Saprospiraceae bacterium]|nr:gliding motility-associated C-terminal domain-containing protein [Saprospiraceae bacterium]
MKKLFLLSLFFLPAAVVFSQATFQKKLDIFLESPMLRVTPGGDGFYLADVFILNGVNRIYVLKLDAQGNVLWRLEQFNIHPDLKLIQMEAVTDGLVLLFNTVTPTESNADLLKVDTDGTLAWSRRYGAENFTQLFDIETDPNGNLWLSGLHLATAMSDSSYHFLTKAGSDGLPLASKQNYFHYFPNIGYEACRYTDLNWDNVNQRLVYVEDFGVPFNKSYISSPNRGRSCFGYCSGAFVFDEKFTNYKIDALAHSDTLLYFAGWTTNGDFTPTSLTVIGMLDKTGKYGRIVRYTPSVFKPIRSRSGDVVFYIPADNMLVKYDAGLEAVWSIKLDNCNETNHFEAEIAPDGSVYSVRNIDDNTVVAKVLSDGTLSACITYPRTAPVLYNDFFLDWVTYSPTGYFDFQVPQTPGTLALTAGSSASSDFCFRMDASFTIPDLVCLGDQIIPENVDTNAGILHTWDLGNFRSEDNIPVFSMNQPGLQVIYHDVQNEFCHDTTSRNVRVLEHPTIPFGDTLVCGPAVFNLDLSQPAATRYYLDDVLVNPMIQINQDGTYSIRLENSACSVEKDIDVRIVEFEPALLPLDSTYCFGDTVLVALRTDFDRIFWDQKPVTDSILILDGATHFYTARYVPDTACTVQGYYTVPRKKCTSEGQVIFVPNVFAPDGPEPNNVLQAFPTSIAFIQAMNIYNRWGGLVFTYKGETPVWDGTFNGQRAPSDVYTYWIEYQDISDGSVQVQAGDIMLVR